ncbi:VOC family protein [Chloroflexota bacterium]
MNLAKRDKIEVRSINQVGLVLQDLEHVADMYWRIFGIGPWVIGCVGDRDFYDRTYRGKPAYFLQKFALAQVGALEFELIEIPEGTTPHTDFLAEHGEGIQHLQYTVEQFNQINEHVNILGHQGFPLYMSGSLVNGGGVSYVDTRSALKTTWEIVKYPTEFSIPMRKFPKDDTEESPARVRVNAITQVGIVVKNLEQVMNHYSTVLGIGNWELTEFASTIQQQATYLGKPGDYTFRSALAPVGEIQLELVQPVSGDSLFIDSICEHGEGVHHLAFAVDDIEETTHNMNSEGFATLMSGRFDNHSFAYFDTRGPLKTIWKAVCP